VRTGTIAAFDLRTTEKEMLALSLLSSIAQSRVVQWLKAASSLPRRMRD